MPAGHADGDVYNAFQSGAQESSVEPENFHALLLLLRKPDRKWAENQTFYEENLKQDAARASFCLNSHSCR